MEVLILVTNEQNCWKTQSGKHFGLAPLWGSVTLYCGIPLCCGWGGVPCLGSQFYQGSAPWGVEQKILYDKESGEGYKSVPLRHKNSDASQDALKLVPDSSF